MNKAVKKPPTPIRTQGASSIKTLTSDERADIAMRQLQSLKVQWEESPIEKAFRGLIVGMKGTGKTYSLLTLPRPLLIDVFDPDGLSSIEDDNGNLPEGIYANRFYPESREKPTQFAKWLRSFRENEKNKLFEHLGAYVIDSSTNWLVSLIWKITADRVGAGRKRPNFLPAIDDWNQQKLEAIDLTMRFMSLPCSFVTTGHLVKDFIVKVDKNGQEVSRTKEYNILIGPKAGANLLTLYSDSYIAEYDAVTNKYYWRTTYEREGKRASSRLSQGGKLNPVEPQDFKALFKKVGVDYKDKT